MADPTFEPATREAVLHIAAHLRAADRVELAVTNPGQTPAEILLEALGESRWATVVRVDGEPALVYGVAQHPDPHLGVPWMLATDAILRIRRYFVVHCRAEVRLMQQRYVGLVNRVHRDNALAIRWLQWLGFTVDRENPVGELLNFWKGGVRCVAR